MNHTGTPDQGSSVAQTVINTASDRTKALIFNYASEALNNSFFLDFLVRVLILTLHAVI
jgi:Fe-Mn family superoxide dismutase